jgi:hypothetical protein
MDHVPKRIKKDSRRTTLMKAGTISFRNTTVECLVLNISAGGAGLVIESDVPLPFVFDLVIDGGLDRWRCLAVWRIERRLGVSFDFDRGAWGASAPPSIEQPSIG